MGAGVPPEKLGSKLAMCLFRARSRSGEVRPEPRLLPPAWQLGYAGSSYLVGEGSSEDLRLSLSMDEAVAWAGPESSEPRSSAAVRHLPQAFPRNEIVLARKAPHGRL
jgi:hypothetical protein